MKRNDWLFWSFVSRRSHLQGRERWKVNAKKFTVPLLTFKTWFMKKIWMLPSEHPR